MVLETLDGSPRYFEEKLHPNGRVLVVDDEKRVLNFLGIKLNASGFGVVKALNFDQTRERLSEAEREQKSIDLILCDLNLRQGPEKNGFGVAKMAKGTNIPFVLFTGNDITLSESQLKEKGIHSIITKPFNPDDLVEHLLKVRKENSEKTAGPAITHS